MWRYRGTKILISIGDKVNISKSQAERLNVKREAEVTGLHGFITVQLSDGNKCDFDARSITKR